MPTPKPALQLFKFHTRITHTLGDHIDVHVAIRTTSEKNARDMLATRCTAIGNAAWPEFPVFFTTTDSHSTPKVRSLSELQHPPYVPGPR